MYSSNKKTIENTNRLISYLTEAIDNTAQREGDLLKLCRMIQDQIYINRRDSWPIPDTLYNLLRNREESVMIDSALDLESQLLTKQIEVNGAQ